MILELKVHIRDPWTLAPKDQIFFEQQVEETNSLPPFLLMHAVFSFCNSNTGSQILLNQKVILKVLTQSIRTKNWYRTKESFS